jgi:hypothetical protein
MSNTMYKSDDMHWTDMEFIKLARKGYKYGWLPHGGQPYEDDYHNPKNFKGANDLNEIAKLAGTVDYFSGTQIFYALSPADSCRGMPPHHHFMAFIFPKTDTPKNVKPQWWVLGYVVELWRYKL